MKMLEAFDLTGSLRDAGEPSGVSHHTVARYVAACEAGGLSDRPPARPQLVDELLPKLEKWIERSEGKLRADVAHDTLLALGYTGSERTTRRAVVAVKRNYRLGRVRLHRGVGERAGDVAAVRLRRRTAHQRGEDDLVRGVVGVAPLPGGAGDPGQDRPEGLDVEAATWDDDPGHEERQVAVAQAIDGVLDLNPWMSVLDVGGGTDRLSILLADRIGSRGNQVIHVRLREG